MQTVNSKTTIRHCGTPSPKVLKLNGYSAIECCTNIERGEGFMFLKEHMLLFIKEGIFKFSYGKTEYEIQKNQMVFLRKDILVEYPESNCSNDSGKIEYVCISLKNELIKEFIKLGGLCNKLKEESLPVTVNPVESRLLKFIDSLEPYFNEAEKMEENLIRIKLLELLFNLDNKILVQLMDLREYFRTDITALVEENIMNSLSLRQLAVLAGRSLSSFRRDFVSIYNIPPSEWIRKRRLEKAKELLRNTSMTITDVCYTLGFENLAHFSRLFKSHFHYSPSAFKLAEFVHE